MESFLLCRSPDDADVSSTWGDSSDSHAQYISDRLLFERGQKTSLVVSIWSSTGGDKRTGCVIKYIPFLVEDATSSAEGQELRKYLRLSGLYVDRDEIQDSDYREVRLSQAAPISAKAFLDPQCPKNDVHCGAANLVEPIACAVGDRRTHPSPAYCMGQKWMGTMEDTSPCLYDYQCKSNQCVEYMCLGSNDSALRATLRFVERTLFARIVGLLRRFESEVTQKEVRSENLEGCWEPYDGAPVRTGVSVTSWKIKFKSDGTALLLFTDGNNEIIAGMMDYEIMVDSRVHMIPYVFVEGAAGVAASGWAGIHTLRFAEKDWLLIDGGPFVRCEVQKRRLPKSVERESRYLAAKRNFCLHSPTSLNPSLCPVSDAHSHTEESPIEDCRFPSELSCIGKPFLNPEAGTITISLVNNVGYPITLTPAIFATGDCANPSVASVGGNPPPHHLLNGEQTEVTNRCPDFGGNSFESKLTLNYVHSQNELTYPVTGTVIGRLWRQATEKFEEGAGRVELSEPPTAASPITMPGRIELERAGRSAFTIGFYNNEVGNIASAAPMISASPVGCVNSVPAGVPGSWTAAAVPVVTANPKPVNLGDSVTFSAFINGPGTMPKGDSICTLRISTTTKEFYLHVP